MIGEFYLNVSKECDAYVPRKYKTIDKKVQLVAMALSKGSEQKKKKVASEPMLRCHDINDPQCENN